MGVYIYALFFQDAGEVPPYRLFYISTDELYKLAERLNSRGVDKIRLGEKLFGDAKEVPSIVEHYDGQHALFTVLSLWRDSQPYRGDVRGLLIKKLQTEFPKEMIDVMKRNLTKGVT